MYFVWILSLVACTYGLETTRLWKPPPPMKGFNLMPYLGQWYIQLRKAPCSFANSNEFTDYETYLSILKDNTILLRETSRNKICNTLNMLAYPGKMPGTFVQDDPTGDDMSGSYVVVATDYKSWSLTYGCTKMSISGDKCDDPWLSVKTRKPYPSRAVLAQVDKVMWKLWRAALTDLQPVRRTQSCMSDGGGMKQGGVGGGMNQGGFGGGMKQGGVGGGMNQGGFGGGMKQGGFDGGMNQGGFGGGMKQG